MKTIKRIFALVLILCLASALCSGLAAYAEADDALVSGEFGDGFSYTYNPTFRTLVIRGEGALPAFDGEEKAPWAEDAAAVTRILMDDGITAIGAGAFDGMRNLSSVVFPASLETVDAGAFSDCGYAGLVSTVGSTTELAKLLAEIPALKGAAKSRLSDSSLKAEMAAMESEYTPVNYYAPDPDTDRLLEMKRIEKEQAIAAIKQYYGLD
ncbi:MAG: leucine-rich repeat protein [Oscillospiraceae bacterium]|nr:leucine-rich repeat protein [Oscillospiraceae bacterium]